MDFDRQPNNVSSGLKHLGTHDFSEFVPFAVSLLCLLMVGTIMSLCTLFCCCSLRGTKRTCLLVRAAFVTGVTQQHSSLLRSVFVFHIHPCCVVTRPRLVS